MIQEIQVGIVDTRVPGDAGAEMVAPHSLGRTCKTTAVQATAQSLAVSVLDLIATRAGEPTGSAIAKSVELARYAEQSYVRSRAYGDLNDFNQFFGNDPQAVIQPNQRGRLNFDAPNRLLAWGEIAAPWKLTFAPVLDTHTGSPYSTVDQYREFVGPRNESRFLRFVSTDLQVWRQISLPKEKHAKIGFGVFNVFNHPNYRDVQNDLDSIALASSLTV
jgi:hypothetical protein